MNRPFFALGVLLTSLIGSLLVVGSTNAQSACVMCPMFDTFFDDARTCRIAGIMVEPVTNTYQESCYDRQGHDCEYEYLYDTDSENADNQAAHEDHGGYACGQDESTDNDALTSSQAQASSTEQSTADAYEYDNYVYSFGDDGYRHNAETYDYDEYEYDYEYDYDYDEYGYDAYDESDLYGYDEYYYDDRDDSVTAADESDAVAATDAMDDDSQNDVVGDWYSEEWYEAEARGEAETAADVVENDDTTDDSRETYDYDEYWNEEYGYEMYRYDEYTEAEYDDENFTTDEAASEVDNQYYGWDCVESECHAESAAAEAHFELRTGYDTAYDEAMGAEALIDECPIGSGCEEYGDYQCGFPEAYYPCERRPVDQSMQLYDETYIDHCIGLGGQCHVIPGPSHACEADAMVSDAVRARVGEMVRQAGGFCCDAPRMVTGWMATRIRAIDENHPLVIAIQRTLAAPDGAVELSQDVAWDVPHPPMAREWCPVTRTDWCDIDCFAPWPRAEYHGPFAPVNEVAPAELKVADELILGAADLMDAVADAIRDAADGLRGTASVVRRPADAPLR